MKGNFDNRKENSKRSFETISKFYPLREIQGYETKSRPSLYPQTIKGWEGDNIIGEASLSLPRSKHRRKKSVSETLESVVVQH